MVDLTPQPGNLVTSQQPRTSVSPGQVAAPYNELSDNLDKLADVTMKDIAVPLAKKQAADDLLQQKVTTNADGTTTVVNPATSPLLFGDAATAYKDAVTSGTLAQYGNEMSQRFNEMHKEHATDPQGFKTATDAYLDQQKQSVAGPMGEAIQQEGAQLQTQHFNAITNVAATNDVENNKKSILAQIDDQKNTAIALARQGGTTTPQFTQAVSKMNNSYDALASNPLFKMPQDQIDLEKKNTAALMQGEALNASLDETFNRKNGKAQAQSLLQENILNNPDLRETDRTRLYTQGMARLAYLSGDAKERVDANKKFVELTETTLANGKLKPEDPAVGMGIQQSLNIGDSEGANRIAAAALNARSMRAVNPLPDAIKAEVLGVPGPAGNGPVNQSIPPEGRALLKTIGQTESANRYNATYGGDTFQDYSDHPGEHVPITSGPDVGKTTSAAGYYQFQKATWDQEKQKLGLTDFSPASQDTAAWDLAQTTYKEKTGKDLLTTLKSGQTGDVLPSLSGQWSSLPGGRQSATRYMAPSANGGPGFTADDVQKNPFLLSAYVRSIASDPTERVQSAKQTAEAVGKGLDRGILPSPASVAEVNQAAQLYPQHMGMVADEMNGRLSSWVIAQLPQEQRDQILAAFKEASQGQDAHHVALAAAALKQNDEQTKNMQEHPYDEAHNRGWTPPAMTIDPSKPETVAPALVQRAGLSARIGALNHTPPPPLLDKDDMPKLQTALQSQNAAPTLGAIAQTLKPDEMQTLLKEEAFRTSVTGMSRSGDPAKMNAAYSFMDAQQKQNPLQFDAQFPDGLKDLRAWQSNLAFYTPDAAAKRLLQAYDPDQAGAREASDTAAKKALESVSADNVVSKFSTGWGPIGTGARAPESDEPAAAKGALKADYDQNYKDGFAANGDTSMADKFAMEKLNLKYAVSPANGNRVMAYAPERYYPQVGGSFDWMPKQLDEMVAKQSGVDITSYDPSGVFDTDAKGNRQYGAPRVLVSDKTTAADIANGKPPSYQVVLQDPNGRWSAMTGTGGVAARFRFDPTQPFAERATTMESRRASVMALKSAEPNPFGQAAP